MRAKGGIEDAEAGAQEVDALLSELAPSQREHYQALVGLKEKILENYRKLPGGRVLAARQRAAAGRAADVVPAAGGGAEPLPHVPEHTDRQQLEKELRELEAEVAQEANPRLKDVKEKRLEILRKRVGRFEQAGESREVVSHQLAGIEDLMRLTHEQSITIRDPETVNRQLDALSAEVAGHGRDGARDGALHGLPRTRSAAAAARHAGAVSGGLAHRPARRRACCARVR